MLRLAVRAASGAVAGAAMLTLSRATCEPSPSERARQTLDAELRRRGATDAARNLQFSLKGGRLSVRAELPPEADILSALLPLFRHYPRVTYNADAARGSVHEDDVALAPVVAVDGLRRRRDKVVDEGAEVGDGGGAACDAASDDAGD